MWRDLSILFALALFIRLLAALPQQQPNYMDAAYSYVNALNLAQGRGFVEDFVWNYLDNPGRPPQPSHLYWMPLTSILAWLGMTVGGANYRAAQISFIVLSALLAPMSYGVAYLLSGQRWSSWLAGLFAIFSGLYFPFWTAIDNFTPFAVTGSLALLCAWLGITQGEMREKREGEQRSKNASEQIQNPKSKIQNRHWFILSGLFVGLAHLARADGPLLLIAIILTYLLQLKYHASRLTPHASRFIFYLVLGYLIIMTPWFVRNWQVIETPLSTAGSQTIWFTGYDDLFSYNRELSPQTFFAQGIGPVVQGRWWALTNNLQTALAVWGMIFLLPLTLIGAWQLREHGLIQLAAVYTLLLFTAMTLVFAFPGTRGGLFHSGAALLPFIYAAGVVGLDRAVDWAAARRRRWDARIAKRIFGVGLVVIAMALSGFIYYQRVIKNNVWNSADPIYPAIAAWVAQQNPAAIVMIGNPPAYRYHGGGLSIIVPNENLETTLQVAHHYQAAYLVLDKNHPVSLTKLYENPTAHPALSLVQTFGQGTGNKIYVFEIVQQ